MADFAELFGISGVAGPIGGVYAWWQSRQNRDTLERHEKKMETTQSMLADHKTYVAENYVPVGRFVALETKIDRIYEWIINHGKDE